MLEYVREGAGGHRSQTIQHIYASALDWGLLTLQQKTQKLLDASRLDASIQFDHPCSPHALAPRAACLTGATGFLGAHLLHRLMTTTAADAFCLVRGASVDEAKRRLFDHLNALELWDEAFRPRIHTIPVHDLADRQFGMNDAEYHALAASTDVIYHSAGSLNMAFPYERLSRTNVQGTIEVLRLGAAEQTKPVHFLSSMAIFFTDAHVGDRVIRESDAPLLHDTLKGGYAQSKWVADRLVAAAMDRGLPATIHRPVRTMATAATGAMNDLSDILPLVLKACILLEKCPALDIEVTMVPVDLVTSAMVHFAAQEQSFGKAFHYFHPRPVSWVKLMEIIRKLGYRLEEVSLPEWKRALKQRASSREETRENAKFFADAFLALIAPHFLFYPRPPMDASNVTTGLLGTGIAYPEIDETLMGMYFGYWQGLGFVPAPPEQR